MTTEVESSRVERSRPAVALEEESKTLAAGGKGLHGGYLAVEPRRHGTRGILYVPHSMSGYIGDSWNNCVDGRVLDSALNMHSG